MKIQAASVSRPAFALALAAFGLAASSCCRDSGGGGGGLGPPGGTVQIDFELRTDFALGTPLIGDSLWIDLNGDGRADLVEAGFNDRRLRIGLGAPDGSFLPWQDLETPGEPLRVLAADLLGQGAIDLVLLCLGAGAAASPAMMEAGEGGLALAGAAGTGQQIAVYRADGDNLWSLVSTTPLDSPAIDMAAAALVQGSPMEHLVVPQLERQEVWVFEGAGAGLLPVGVLPARGVDSLKGPVTVAVVEDPTTGHGAIAVGLVGGFGTSLGGVSLLRSDGALAFAPEQILPVIPLLPVVRAISDLVSGDPGAEGGLGGIGDLGVADAHPLAQQLFVLAGEEDFVGLPHAFDNGGPSASVAAADVDGDGRRDLVATLFDSGGLSVRLSQGNAFAEPRLYNTGTAPRGVQAADVNGDGREDLVAVCAGVTSLITALPDGRMRAAEGFFVGLIPQFVAAADLDQDGFVDAISIDASQREIGFLRGLPGRRFELAGSVPLAETEEVTPSYFELADLDGDGFLDVVVSATQAGEVRILFGSGTLPPAAPSPGASVFVGATPRGLALGDVDGDGRTDALVAVAGDGVLRVLRGGPGGLFTADAAIPVAAAPLAVRLVDLDGDGLLDAVVATDAPAAHVLRGDGLGGFSEVAGFPMAAIALSIQVGDLVQDGRPDVLLSQSGAAVEQVLMLENLGAMSFVPRLVPIGVDPGTVELVDADGDGRLDILSPLGSGRLAILAGDGLGNFAPLPTLTGLPLEVPFGTRASTLSDLDGDGRPELLMVSPQTRQVWVARNTSLGAAP